MNRVFNNAVLTMFSFVFFVGCSSKHLKSIQQDAVLAKCDELDRCYLSQDVDGARHCLHQKADLLEQSTVLEPIGRSGILALTYARLCVLDKRNGKTWEAEADLLKAKFWTLKCAELRGTASGSAMKDIQENNALNSVTAGVDERDKGINNGKLPAYVSDSHIIDPPIKQN